MYKLKETERYLKTRCNAISPAFRERYVHILNKYVFKRASRDNIYLRYEINIARGQICCMCINAKRYCIYSSIPISFKIHCDVFRSARKSLQYHQESIQVTIKYGSAKGLLKLSIEKYKCKTHASIPRDPSLIQNSLRRASFRSKVATVSSRVNIPVTITARRKDY